MHDNDMGNIPASHKIVYMRIFVVAIDTIYECGEEKKESRHRE